MKSVGFYNLYRINQKDPKIENKEEDLLYDLNDNDDQPLKYQNQSNGPSAKYQQDKNAKSFINFKGNEENDLAIKKCKFEIEEDESNSNSIRNLIVNSKIIRSVLNQEKQLPQSQNILTQISEKIKHYQKSQPLQQNKELQIQPTTFQNINQFQQEQQLQNPISYDEFRKLLKEEQLSKKLNHQQFDQQIEALQNKLFSDKEKSKWEKIQKKNLKKQEKLEKQINKQEKKEQKQKQKKQFSRKMISHPDKEEEAKSMVDIIERITMKQTSALKKNSSSKNQIQNDNEIYNVDYIIKRNKILRQVYQQGPKAKFSKDFIFSGKFDDDSFEREPEVIRKRGRPKKQLIKIEIKQKIPTNTSLQLLKQKIKPTIREIVGKRF